jgi:hypothetical protein
VFEFDITEKWADLRVWLNGRNGEWFVDDAVYGSLPTHTTQEILEDFGIAWTKANRKRLWREIDRVLEEV